MVTKQRADALQDALNEIEAIRDRISHPRGRRASFIDSMDQQRVDALNEAWDAINGLIEASIEQRAACPPPDPVLTLITINLSIAFIALCQN